MAVRGAEERQREAPLEGRMVLRSRQASVNLPQNLVATAAISPGAVLSAEEVHFLFSLCLQCLVVLFCCVHPSLDKKHQGKKLIPA